MLGRRLVEVGIAGIGAIGLYVGAVLAGGALDAGYSQVANAVSELTGSGAPNWGLLASIFVAYNIVLVGFGWALMRAAGAGRLFQIAVWLFVIGGLSGIGQVTAFRMDAVGSTATTAGTIHLVLAGVSSLLTVATAVLYGFAFRRVEAFRGLSTSSFVTAALLVLTAPAAVLSIGTDVMGLFERVTIGVYLAWVVVVSVSSLFAARGLATRSSRAVSAPA